MSINVEKYDKPENERPGKMLTICPECGESLLYWNVGSGDIVEALFDGSSYPYPEDSWLLFSQCPHCQAKLLALIPPDGETPRAGKCDELSDELTATPIIPVENNQSDIPDGMELFDQIEGRYGCYVSRCPECDGNLNCWIVDREKETSFGNESYLFSICPDCQTLLRLSDEDCEFGLVSWTALREEGWTIDDEIELGL